MSWYVVSTSYDGELGHWGPFQNEGSAVAYADELTEVGEASNYDEIHIEVGVGVDVAR